MSGAVLPLIHRGRPGVVTGISPGVHVGDAVRRLALEQLQPAVDALELQGNADADDVVYDVRKRCRRARALLRLVRAEVGDDVYSRENGALRDAARALSDVRDAAVMVQVHDALVDAGGIAPAGFREGLVERHERLRDELLAGDALPRVREIVAAVLARVETWPVDTVEWSALGAGLERVYSRGREAMTTAFDDPSIEGFHHWRKRVKYLGHQLALLEDLWPEVMSASVESAQALTATLGDAHDLAVLRDALIEAGVDPEREADLLELIDSRRHLFRARARPIGLRLYAEKPSRFVARLGQYWEAGPVPATAA
jgi:CHAD domain-containing protein